MANETSHDPMPGSGRIQRRGPGRDPRAEPRPDAAPRARRRLSQLDGLRGIAALLVVVHHLFGRWAEPVVEETLYPHGNALTHLPVLAYLGAYGVLLFFLISGFVIMMTLERSTGLVDFAVKRAARLWPTMLICATLSTLVINLSGVAFLYPGVEHWHVTVFEYLLSLIFLSPALVSGVLDLEPAQWVEGVYWTLWVEVRFYGLVGFVFLLFRGRSFLPAWMAVQAISTAVELARAAFPEMAWSRQPLVLIFQPGYLAWFSLGLCGYMVWTGRVDGRVRRIAGLALVAILAYEIVTIGGGVPRLTEEAGRVALLYVSVAIPFALFLRRHPVLDLVTWPPIVVIGMASYPLYLFHERAAMAALPYLADAGLPPRLAVALVFAAVIACALAIHRLVERPGRHLFVRAGQSAFGTLEARYPRLRFR